jgi:hypothetical protein
VADHLLDADASAGPSVTAPDIRQKADTAPDGRFPLLAQVAPRPSAVPTGSLALPDDPPYFAGRRRELDALRSDIGHPGLATLRGHAPDGSRVLLVAGRPGSGRTTLAVRLARAVADRYPDGQFFVPLRDGAGEPLPVEGAARALLRALGAEAEPGAGTERVCDALRATLAGRRAVLVLDDVAHADQLIALLPEGPGHLVVATSGGPLPGVPDVRPCTLGGLDPAAVLDLLSHLMGSTRVTNDPSAAELLAHECAGDPTALRLLAAWLAARPRMSLADAVRLLRAAPADPSEPTARAFRLVYGELPQPAARMLRLLVLAPGGVVDPQIASALSGCSVMSARETLENLTACGMLHAERTAERLPPQYRLPGCLIPALRALLAGREREQEVRLARARMLERTVRLLHSCRLHLESATTDDIPRALRFPSRAAAAEWLRGRLRPLLTAARGAVEDGQLDTLARRMVVGLVRALAADPGGGDVAGELYQLHGLVLDVASRRDLHREKATALIHLGDLDAGAGRPRQALDRYRAALAAARDGDDGDIEGRALEAIAGTYLELDDPQRAADWYGRALALRQARGESVHEARLRGRLGSLHLAAGEYGSALREWRAVAAAYRRRGDLPGQVRALTEAARAQEYGGLPEEALRTCRDALHWARQAGERRLEGAVLLRMADTLDRLGDPAGARLQRAAAGELLGPGGGGPRPAGPASG